MQSLLLVLTLILVLAAVEAFTAQLTRPWEATVPGRRNSAFIRLYVSELEKSKADENRDKQDEEDEESFSLADPDIPGSSSHVLASGTTVAATTASTPSVSVTPGSTVPLDPESHSTELAVASSSASPTSSKATMRSCLPDLFAMTRPSNLPGVVLFHLLGTYLTTKATGGALWRLLATPSMLVTLLALLLTSATSMLVNDYYDFKLGNDSSKVYKPLSSQRVPLIVAKRFLSYLYAGALLCAAAVPGVTARTAVVTGLMLTFWYTQHLKPRTWLKNTVCASLIALSPLTSGAAAISLTGASWINVAPLLRVVAMLFVGILGREITMDINDVADDKDHGVRTVPVVYGRKFASTIGLFCNLGVSGFALSGPVLESVLGSPTGASMRRLGMAAVGSLALVRRSWQVFRSEGLDPGIVNRSVDEGLLTVVFLLASFL